jgi:hypothetical protein
VYEQMPPRGQKKSQPAEMAHTPPPLATPRSEAKAAAAAGRLEKPAAAVKSAAPGVASASDNMLHPSPPAQSMASASMGPPASRAPRVAQIPVSGGAGLPSSPGVIAEPKAGQAPANSLGSGPSLVPTRIMPGAPSASSMLVKAGSVTRPSVSLPAAPVPLASLAATARYGPEPGARKSTSIGSASMVGGALDASRFTWTLNVGDTFGDKKHSMGQFVGSGGGGGDRSGDRSGGGGGESERESMSDAETSAPIQSVGGVSLFSPSPSGAADSDNDAARDASASRDTRSSSTARRPSGHALAAAGSGGAGGRGGGRGNLGMDGGGADRVRAAIEGLNAYAERLSDEVIPLSRQIEALELRKAEIVSRDQLPLLHRITAVQEYLIATRSILLSKVEQTLLVERIRQMYSYLARIPSSEKSERSLLESWNAMFDVHAIVPKALAKDHCDYCKKPLLIIRKQAQLQCVYCARMTEHLMPLGHGNAWMKTNVTAQPENKRIKSLQLKLNQFLPGSTPIPDDIVLGVRHALRARTHTSAGTALASPAAVASSLTAVGHDKYVPYAAKIAIIVNGHAAQELTHDQAKEIVDRMRVAQFAFNLLVSSGKLSSRTFYTNHVANQIVLIMNLPWLQAVFPAQKTKRQLREQSVFFRQLCHYLRQIDTVHQWP